MSPARCFKGLPIELSHSQVYVDHLFDHPDYNRCLSEAPQEFR